MSENNTFEPKNMLSEKNKMMSIGIIVGAILVLGLVWWWYQSVYLKNRSDEAASTLAKVEQFILVDSLNNKALNGEGGNMGLLKIASEYENTKSGNIANYYIGSIYLRQGKFQDAINYLQKFTSTSSPVLDPLATGLLGDAYSELKQYDKAADFYKKAADKSDNAVTSPMFLKKLALVKEQNKDFKGAAEIYKTIKSKYPQSAQAVNIDAYISKAETQAGN